MCGEGNSDILTPPLIRILSKGPYKPSSSREESIVPQTMVRQAHHERAVGETEGVQ